MRQALLDTIDVARDSLLIVGFMLDSEEIVSRIVAKGRIIEIIIHLDHHQTMEWDSATKAADRLRRAGAQVFLHRESWRESLHAKVIIADEEEAIVGSANLTDRGADRNFEIGLRLRGPTVRILRKAVLNSLGRD
jgi:phosphatidylserine/phosphatidylglycerophosphate/cardiolipin synthase-like enzyme